MSFNQVFAETHGISQSLTFYTLAILNAASIFGRISPNFLADKLGSLNLLTVMCAGTGHYSFFWTLARTSPGLYEGPVVATAPTSVSIPDIVTLLSELRSG